MIDKELFDTSTVRVPIPVMGGDVSPSARIEETGRYDRAILFADVSGSTKLYEQAGNEVAFAAINECIELMKAHTVRSAGTVREVCAALAVNCSCTAFAVIRV